ncbi:hypothetical protein Tco_1302080 [Tanacetum coccineum]
MASNPEQVRLNVLTKLQEALDEEAIFEEQILTLMHRFADRFTDRRVKINNLMVLHDHPLIEYGKYALGCMTGADMKKCVYLKSVRDELLRLVAYPVVNNYIKNTWSKFGLVKSMLNSSNELYFFKFSSQDGMDAMLKNEDVGNVLVLVKFYGVPMTAFSKDGLSAIATKLDTHLMLDSYTSDMCIQSWGRSSYARAIIELRADVD